MTDIKKAAIAAHRKSRGKLATHLKVSLKTIRDMSLYYTPGVAEPCKVIYKNPSEAFKLTSKWNTIAVVTDGSAVLGLGNIGGLAGMPVMEGKCALFKTFADVDAFPICLKTQDVNEIVNTIKNISLSFGGINLEDIAAPRCFEIEERLKKELDIPVFHDDQHGTAVICLAGLINALKVVGKKASHVRIVVSGAGAAGISIAKLFLKYGFKDLILLDSKGAIFAGRADLNDYKKKIAKVTNLKHLSGGLTDVIKGADMFIGVSKPNILTTAMVKTMKKKSVIFAMSNPDPEILPKDAFKGGACIVATGRSDYPNQINNVLVFPGIFRGALDARIKNITDEMQISAAKAIAALVSKPTPKKIIPDVFDKRVAKAVASSIKRRI